MSQKECTSHLCLSVKSCSHKIQGIEVCLQNHHWLCTPLPKFILLQTFVPSRNLLSASVRRFIVPSQRGTKSPKSLSQTFKWNVPSWWNDLPNSLRAAESLAIFKNRLKTHLFHLYLTLYSSTLNSNYILKKRLLDYSFTACSPKKNLTLAFLIFLYSICFFLFIIQLTQTKKASDTSLLYSFCILLYNIKEKKTLLRVLR